jgi:hypothetical protein
VVNAVVTDIGKNGKAHKKDMLADPDKGYRSTKVSISVMEQAVATVSGKTGTTLPSPRLSRLLLPVKVKLLKQSPNASEESASLEKRSRLNPKLRRKKSASLSMITSKLNKPTLKVFSRSKK